MAGSLLTRNTRGSVFDEVKDFSTEPIILFSHRPKIAVECVLELSGMDKEYLKTSIGLIFEPRSTII